MPGHGVLKANSDFCHLFYENPIYRQFIEQRVALEVNNFCAPADKDLLRAN